MRLGYIEEAREIEGLAIGAKSDPATLEAMASADFLGGDIVAGCAKVQLIAAPRDNAYGAKLRALCYVASGELDAADLALGLLRERGALTEADEAILGPLVSGGKPRAGAEAVDAAHYAALKLAGAPLAVSPNADAGVLRALAADESASWPQRLGAAKRAAAMGVMSAASLKDLFGGAAFEVAAVAGAAEAFRQNPDDPAALASAYQLARSKSAPEFVRDRAALIADVVAGARDFETLFASAALFADDIRAFDGLLVSTREAEAFALARLALGDVAGAEGWLGAGAAGGLASDETLGAPSLVAAAKAGKSYVARGEGARGAPSEAALASAVDAAIEAAGERITGQGALAALAASRLAAEGDPVAEVVVARGLAIAGMEDLARRRTAERLLQNRFAATLPPPTTAAPVATPAALGVKKPAPRVKPAPSQ